MPSWFPEALGYLASVIVAISLTMQSVLRLRIINLVGAVCFSIYGVLIQAYPVAVLNGFIALINVYYLYQMQTHKAYFTVLPVRAESPHLRLFLQFYAPDIQQFFPNFQFQPTATGVQFFVLRDVQPVGLFIADRHEADALHVHLDYVIPGYRDLKPGSFLYQHEAAHFRAEGVRFLYTTSNTPAHRQYLQRVGFTPVPNDPRRFVRALDGDVGK